MFLPTAIKSFHAHVLHLSPSFLFAKSQWAIPSTDSSSPPVLVSPAHPWGSTLSSPSLLFFCFKSLHSNATQQPGEDFYFFSYLLPLLPIWADKGLQGLIWCLSLSPQLVSGLRANCRVWSVCQLIEISHSPPHLRPLSLQSSSPLCVWI